MVDYTGRLTPKRFSKVEFALNIAKPAVASLSRRSKAKTEATPTSTSSTLTIPFADELFQGYRKLTLSDVSISGL